MKIFLLKIAQKILTYMVSFSVFRTLSQLTEKQNILRRPLYLIDEEIADWNDISVPGWYSGKETAKNSPISTPNSDGWINALVLASNNSTYFLMVIAFTGINAHNIYIRGKSNNVWKEWEKII